MVVKVNVYPASVCNGFDDKTGYVAIAEGMEVCYAKAETMDGAIEKFKKEYGGLLQLQFQDGDKFEFDFHVKLS